MNKPWNIRALKCVAVFTFFVVVRSAAAQVEYEFIDRGVPTDGTTTATGYRAYTLRFSSSSALIGALDASHWGGFTGPMV